MELLYQSQVGSRKAGLVSPAPCGVPLSLLGARNATRRSLSSWPGGCGPGDPGQTQGSSRCHRHSEAEWRDQAVSWPGDTAEADLHCQVTCHCITSHDLTPKMYFGLKYVLLFPLSGFNWTCVYSRKGVIFWFCSERRHDRYRDVWLNIEFQLRPWRGRGRPDPHASWARPGLRQISGGRLQRGGYRWVVSVECPEWHVMTCDDAGRVRTEETPGRGLGQCPRDNWESLLSLAWLLRTSEKKNKIIFKSALTFFHDFFLWFLSAQH